MEKSQDDKDKGQLIKVVVLTFIELQVMTQNDEISWIENVFRLINYNVPCHVLFLLAQAVYISHASRLTAENKTD